MARLLRKRKESQAGERGNIKVRLGKVQERKIVHLVSLFLGLCEYCCYNRGGWMMGLFFVILIYLLYPIIILGEGCISHVFQIAK